MSSRENPGWDHVWAGGHLATMTAAHAGYGVIENAAVAVRDGRIAWIGAARDGRSQAGAQGVPVTEIDGLWLTPGLIDCHTHLVYGGSRVAEFERRLEGASYEQIARAGGGIRSTVAATRAAGRAQLLRAAGARLRRLSEEGVTTVEVKSGYGLDLPTERRMLEVARALESVAPVSIRTTYLGLHALPEERRDDRRGFIDDVCGPWLQTLAEEGLVDAVDAFCENIAFTPGETAKLLAAAQGLKIPAHLHAGQLSDLGAAELAARYGAMSADHLEYLGEAGARALAAAGTVAVLLPCAYYTLRQTVPPPVPLLREAGVPLAVATDCNPGTSPCVSLLLALNMACTLFGLTAVEALTGATRQAARALGLERQIGTLEVGKRADFALWEVESPAQLCYGLGANPCVGVVRNGKSTAARQQSP